jgi:hypothetical protein
MNTAQMPQPGDLITAFSVQVGRCFRMVYSEQLQATHCYQTPEWKGPWRDVKGRSWYVEGMPGARAEGQPVKASAAKTWDEPLSH